MAAFRFTLAKVLEYRRRLVDLRARDLAAAESAAAALAARIRALRAEQDACAAAAGDGPRLDVTRLAARTAWVALLDRRLAVAGAEHARALAAVAEARAALQAAWRDREVLEQLRERQQQAWAWGERRRETAELDEIGGQRRARADRTGVAG